MIKAIIFIIVISTYSIVFLDETTIYDLGDEDGLIENLGATFFITSSFLFFTIFFKSSGSGNSFGKFHTNRNVFYLLLGIFFIICFGEEISWGQRIIGWNTPAMMEDINIQGETNLHNLKIFYKNRDKPLSFNMLTLFSAFWLSYFILVPLVSKFSHRANGFFKHIGLPCPPLWMGGLFLTNYFAAKFMNIDNLGLPMTTLESVTELKESNYALNFAIFGLYELRNILSNSRDRVKGSLPY
jgi:hypothetical protein